VWQDIPAAHHLAMAAAVLELSSSAAVDAADTHIKQQLNTSEQQPIRKAVSSYITSSPTQRVLAHDTAHAADAWRSSDSAAAGCSSAMMSA
jgi:hypothetical protein